MRETNGVAVSWQEWRWVLIAALLIVGVAALPYLAVWLLTPSDKVYTGMLFNSFDGHSYLAKMRQGANGEWLFRLPFTPEAQRGTFFYGYYLLLGHVAAWLGLPLIIVYAIARSLNSIGLLLVCYRFAAEFITDVNGRRLAFMIIALSSGLSWVTAAFGIIGLDLVFLETNTFLSILINPHFPLTQALMLFIFLVVASPLDRMEPDGSATIESHPTVPTMRTTLWRAILGGAASLALTIVFPMMLLIVFATLGVFLVWRSLVQRQWLSADWARAIITGLFASPLMIYYLVLIYSDPVVAEWYAQDAVIIITPSPWQALIGYGFLVPLAIAGAVWCVRQRRGFFLMVWAILALGLVYTPIALQCRLLTGLHVCIALLAALGLIHVVRPAAGKWRTLVLPVAMLLLVPSTLAVMVFHASIVTKLGWPFFITTGERAALTWLQESVPTNEVVLASPKMGLMIPAWAGQRVVYGHPLETIAAAEKKTILEDFFAGKTTAVDILRKYEIRYIFVGPKEKELGDFKANQLQAEFSLDTPYVNEEVTIYRLSDLDGGEH